MGALYRYKLFIAFLAVVICAVFIIPLKASNTVKRGDYPRCQQECLNALDKRMAQLSEEYKKKEDRLKYEKRVEEARADYDECMDGCVERLPVK